MNDFTKQELQDMLWHITSKTVVPVGNELVPKIQDMIENYYEHEYCEISGAKLDKRTKGIK